MKITGIIAEYNPFHQGHAYQLSYAREALGSDYCIALMSPDFTQRGQAAVFSSYQRTRLALAAGADLVLSLPLAAAVGGAESFAACGVNTLANTGLPMQLLFGAETADPALFDCISDLLLREPPAFKEELARQLSSGKNYPSARAAAILCCMQAEDKASALSSEEGSLCFNDAVISRDRISEFLSKPNNILGLEYTLACKRRDSQITALPMKRLGASYHEADISASHPSAGAIRTALLAGDFTLTEHEVPEVLLPLYRQLTGLCLCSDDFSLLLHQKLLDCRDFTEFAGITESFSNRIQAKKKDFTDFSSFAERLHSKDLTDTRIMRNLSHILLGIDPSLESLAKEAPYISVAGVRKSALPLLSQLCSKASVPVITEPKKAKELLSEEALRLYEKDCYGECLYEAVLLSKYQYSESDRFHRPFLVVE